MIVGIVYIFKTRLECISRAVWLESDIVGIFGKAVFEVCA